VYNNATIARTTNKLTLKFVFIVPPQFARLSIRRTPLQM
jgi:hypothetical protein